MSVFAERPAAGWMALVVTALCSSAAPLSAQTTQLISCRRSVLEQYPDFGTRVTVTPAGQDGQGNHTISWTATQQSGGANGTCLVDRNNRVLRVDVANRPPTGGPQIQPPVAPGYGSTRLICESQEARRKECPIPSDRQVRLVRTISNNACIETKSWGTTAGTIWVSAGCRGEFELTSRPVVDPGAGATRQITCGSLGGNQVQCRTLGYATNVRLVRDLSGRCRQNSNWGYTDSFIWANSGCRALFEVSYGGTTPVPPTPPTSGTRRFMCGNANGTQAQCQTTGQATEVLLVRNLGGTLCRENSNWGHTSSYIWTRGGCRAEFEVTYNNSGPVPPTPPVASRTMTCGNSAGSSMSCNPMGRVASVRLVRDYTGSGCRQGSTWGFTQDDLWVRGGCYGQFAVSYVGVYQPQAR
ncbi:MAG: DUF3011 domain-containing protein [Gemmatimonadota bacterium]|nr:DUF3011 domain-containing protein [Gemmatimonadota bacterium]